MERENSQPADAVTGEEGGAVPARLPDPQPGMPLSPQTDGGAPAPRVGMIGPEGVSISRPAYIYALGRIEVRYPSLAIEKEFAQATGRAETAGLTDRQAFHEALSQRQNRYLARQLCWVLSIEGLETYILSPREPADLDLFLESIRREPQSTDVDVVVGIRGPLAPPEMCNGLMLPLVAVDQVYSFDRSELVQAIPRPEQMAEEQEEQFRSTAGELFDRVMQMADNAGATDEHRALNYLALRYPALYNQTAEMFSRNFSLKGVEVRPSRLSGPRRIVDVIFSFTHRETDVTEKYFVRVDVSEEFPFLVTKMSPYYDR